MARQEEAMAEANQAEWGTRVAAAPSIGGGEELGNARTAAAASDERAARWAWAHVSLGSLGVLAVSLFYFLSPLAAVTPELGADLAPARAAALTDSGFMRMIGAVGVLADLIIAVGLLALAHATPRLGGGRRALGFCWLACAALVFTLVDALAGFSLRASAAAGLTTFAVIKPLFDVLTGAGAFGYGAGALLVAWPGADGAALAPRPLALAISVVGAVLAVAGPACVWGVSAGPLVGLGLTLETALFAALAVRNTWTG
jgi:hypothetical protein